MKSDEEPIVVQQTYQASVAKVWNAITQVEHMREWYFENIPDFEARVGFETSFDVHSGERCFPHRWRITEVTDQKRVQYDWRYEGYAGVCIVNFDLGGDDDSATLKVTCRAVEDFDDDIPEFERQSGVDGWQYLLQDSLKSYLEQ